MTERMDALVADVQGRLNDWDDPLRLDDETLQLCQDCTSVLILQRIKKKVLMIRRSQ